jgi:hypothetical protein
LARRLPRRQRQAPPHLHERARPRHSANRFRLAGSLSFVGDSSFFGDVMTQSLGLVGKIVRIDCG